MKTLGNIIRFLLGGLEGAAVCFLAGILFCVTIVGIPVGKQCFKLATLSFSPFGMEIVG